MAVPAKWKVMYVALNDCRFIMTGSHCMLSVYAKDRRVCL